LPRPPENEPIVRNRSYGCYIRGVMKHDHTSPAQPLNLPMAQSGAPSSSCVRSWGDIPPAILSERQPSQPQIGPPPASATDLAVQLLNHAVFNQPLPAPCNAHPRMGGLFGDPEPREWYPRSGWTAAPSERGSKYAVVYSRASIALQVAMREWIPSLYFDGVDRFDDLDMAQGMIAWRASRPAIGEHVDRLSYDILDPAMMSRCFFWVERNIRPLLSSLLPITDKFESSRRSFFDPRHTNRILLRLRRAQRGFQMILKVEEDIITQLVKLVASTPKLQTKAKGQPRAVATEVERSVERTFATVESRLRRIIPHGDVETVMRMLVIVLTKSLEQSQTDAADRAA
jgi:hypothetical protein